jgi:beta-lactam-binding protein with PASTA domain
MKRTVALSFALSLLTATGAFASNSSTAPAVHAPVLSAQQLDTAKAEVELAGAGNKTFDRAAVSLDKKVLVAENRKEFGSQYQRY